MKEQDPLEQISKKLSVLIAMSFIKNIEKMTNVDAVRILVRFGLSNQDIANILGTTRGTVEVLKSRTKNKKKK